MLIEFTVGNFKSFRDKTTFSMVAAPIKSEDPRVDRDNIIPVSKNLNLLRSAAVYGANASGKSNLGAALRFMQGFVVTSSATSHVVASTGFNASHIAVEPFLFNTETQKQPSFFEVVFFAEGRQHRYGFEVDRQRVVSEWLFHVPGVKEAALFVREGQKFEPKPGFKEGRGLEERTRPDTLFLSVAAQFNGEVALRVTKWFIDLTIMSGLQDDFRSMTMMALRNDGTREEVLRLFGDMDLGFAGVRFAGEQLPDDLPADWPEDRRMAVSRRVSERLQTFHPIFDREGNAVAEHLLDLDVHESQGTRKLVALAGILLYQLNNGLPLFVDELDARLHPLMTRQIIEMFQSPITNPKGAQLIFATHDTNLLDRALLRRDQIWFAEKDRQGATHLYSLSDYRPRNDAAFEKNYLAGRYGAIPFLGDLTRLPLEPPDTASTASEEDAPAPEVAHA